MKRTTLLLLGSSLLLLSACVDRVVSTEPLVPASPRANTFQACDVAALRSAITAANNTPGAHTIDLLCSISIHNVDNTFNGSNGLPVITGNVTINGNGTILFRLADAPPFRIFYVTDNATVAINDLVISGGLVDGLPPVGDGGGIFSTGSLTLTNVTVSGNTGRAGGGIANEKSTGKLTLIGSTVSGNNATLTGGGIFNQFGSTTVSKSTVSDNSAGEWGGGISNFSFGNLLVTQSTVSDNSAGRGGGIFSMAFREINDIFVTAIINSTISGNTARVEGGGLTHTTGLARISHTTITNNRAPVGGGVYSANNFGTRSDVKASIIWGNTSDGNTANDAAASSEVNDAGGNRFNSLGFNLVGRAGANVNFDLEFKQVGDRTGNALAEFGNDWLLPLSDNGGPASGATLTHALESFGLTAGSPAINLGTCTDAVGAPVSTDQRGIRRPVLGECDIGAFEFNLPGAPRPPAVQGFGPFSAPVENPPTINAAKAGQVVPLRWRLLDDSGNPVTTLSGVTVSASNYNCGLSITPDQPEETGTGKSALMNLGNGQYQFNWQTPKAYANSCKMVTVLLGDGSGLRRTVLFRFTR